VKSAFQIGGAIALFLLTFSVHAIPISYRFTGVGSGTLNGTPFNTAQFIIQVATTDTTLITSSKDMFNELIYNTPSSITSTIAISGIGSDTITEGTRLFSNTSVGAIGLQRSADGDLMNLGGFPNYDLKSAAGPVTGVPGAINQFGNLGTSHGSLNFSSVPTATFQAFVPEPGALSLLTVTVSLALRRSSRQI